MQLTYEKYYDKVRGGWVGKCAGGILGAPIEGFKRFNDIEISDKLFETNFPNDDLDLQVLWLDMVIKKGVHISEKDFAEHWINHVGFPWNEYGIATRNLRIGLMPPESGRLNNGYWKHSMGCPIRSEIWGMLCAGYPEKAAFYAGMDGSLDHHGFSVQAEQYFSVCSALAFHSNDIKGIMQNALEYISEGSLMFDLVKQVFNWNSKYPVDVVIGKIKSYYGDADFTSAPMNIAFTILTLLNSNNEFSCITQALHMGHDSDCVVATAGALIGIINGYDAIPELWKKRVGNELLISDAITGIYNPGTIEKLTELTCHEGLKFRNHFSGEAKVPCKQSYLFNYQLPLWIDDKVETEQCLVIEYTNLTMQVQKVSLRLLHESIKFQHNPELMIIAAGEKKIEIVPFSFDLPNKANDSIGGKVEIWIDGRKAGEEKIAIPYYGSWLLLGPFIQDDPSLEPCDKAFPDHGLSGLPSVQYMNHDRVSTDTEFLSQEEITRVVKNGLLDEQPFYSTVIHCASLNIPFMQYIGRGERTFYLYSELMLEESQTYWLSFGTNAKIVVYVNEEIVFVSRKIKRCWPGAYTVLQVFQKGVNSICLRIDSITDETCLQFGFKEFANQHPHQSQWSLRYPFFNLKQTQ